MKNVHKKRRGKTYLGVVMALILTMGLSACGGKEAGGEAPPPPFREVVAYFYAP